MAVGLAGQPFMTFALAGMMQVFRQVPLRDFVPAQPSSNNRMFFHGAWRNFLVVLRGTVHCL